MMALHILDRFNSRLQEIYRLAQTSGVNVLSTSVQIAQVTGGQAQVDYNKSQSITMLIKKITDKGGTILIKDGANYKYVNEITEKNANQIVVQQVPSVQGYITPVIYASYLPSRTTTDINEAIQNQTFIEISGARYSNDEVSLKALNESVASLKIEIEKLNDKDRTTLIRNINTKISKSLFNKALNYNRWMFRDKSIDSRKINYRLASNYSKMLTENNMFIDIANPINPSANIKAYYIDAIETLHSQIATLGYSLQDATITKDMQFINMNSNNFKSFETNVNDVYAPEG